ncbi:hypothetical protein OMP38_14285 [Cohnella ginsengisoli]|uniref:Uncharacterized protein n=1 Tax=Cohnella ginsengisoli TaxID=425004 RepID=A0A9X4QNT1_9BACL|nr:hypothetical protein [Cohnella ginsengisoli]MDG0791885.1 hypothetical protein [Cohnella ginsengisoli]
MEGIPQKVHVNRLEPASGNAIVACTNHGLFRLSDDRWSDLRLPFVCYAYKEIGDIGFAATDRGLWCLTEKGWRNIGSTENPVYDLFATPHFIFLALPWGIAMYDRLTCAWEQFALKTAIVRLAAMDGALLGIAESGEIALGDLKGGFDRFRMPGIFAFNAVRLGQSLFFCTDRGLYRAAKLRGQFSLLSVSLGCPVTDVDLLKGQLHMATLNEGIQTIPWS